MVIPKTYPDFSIENLELIGLNTIDAKTLRNISYQQEYSQLEEVHYVPSRLDPYYNQSAVAVGLPEIKSKYLTRVDIGGETAEVFSIDDLYGGDVIEKVTVFGKLTANLASQLDFDIIHAHDWMTMAAGMEIKARTGKPLVMHIHSLEIDRGGESRKGWVYQMEKRGMEYADLLMPVSNFTANVIHQHYGISMNKIFPVHNGIRPVKAFKGERPFKEKIVLFVGRLTRQKGPEYFLEIASRVLEVRQDVRFVMAGTGDAFHRLLDKSSYRHLGNRFHLTGFLNLEKVHAMLSIADVYCMPSVSEPFGLSAVEAAQFGIPVVMSKQSGAAEVMKGSLTFDFWDINRASEYIIRLLDDEVLHSKVVEDANIDLKSISWELSAEKVMQGYDQYNLIS
jgi:hypothetical protein